MLLICFVELPYSDHNTSKLKKSLQATYNSLLATQNEDGGFCWAKRNNLNLNDFIYTINFKMLLNKCDFMSNGISKIKTIVCNITKNGICWKYSSLETMKLKTDESDLFSTWFRLTSIAFIEKTFPDIHENSFDWNLRNKCGLGFYNK